ncbi:MAG TPA: nucleoid-associated protein, partial [Cryomorphaceae bacterium]|nr:nucleoid-associated protein [Cryomorphaceae bacterium]
VAMVDRVNRGQEAQYWKDDFLQIAPCRDSFHHTKELMQCTREFLTNEASPEMSKANQIDLLNRSVGYFKEHEQFSREEFEEEVFQNPELSGAFRQYAGENLNDMPAENGGSFELSPHAVKKYSKDYKSVLKLDKNFHVYIHGDRGQIEQGQEADGRKYYKIYYREEH